MTASYDRTARIWLRRRPERWWAIFVLAELWATLLFAAALAWSILGDRRHFRGASEPA